jgi:DNA-directed RNA polymerase specialized sigma24 family protein
MTLLERPVPDSSRETAVRLLGDYGREGGRGQALRVQLGERFPECHEEMIEDAVQSACRSFLDEAEGISDPGKAYLWIRTAAYRAVLRELRQRRRAIPLVPTEGVIGEAIEERPGPAEELIGLEDTAGLEVLAEEVAGSLSGERRAILALWGAGRRRSEIAAELGLGERSVKRALEEIMREARGALANRAGGGCGEGESLILRFVCGLADAGEALRARAHLDGCGRCSAFAEELEGWRERAGALLGPVTAEVASPGLIGRAVGRVGDAISSARRHVMDGGAQVKQQAAAAGYARGADPTPLAGIRPGAVAAVVAGCLAIGTGATYCAQQGVDPLTAATGLIAGTQEEAKPEPEPPAKEPQAPTESTETPNEADASPVYETAEEAPATTSSTPAETNPSSSSEVESRHEAEPAPEEVTAPAERQFEAESPDYPVTETSSSESSSSESSSSSSGSGAATTEASKPARVPANEAPQFGGP